MADVYAAVYHALDAAVAASNCLASSEAKIQRALTQFRGTSKDRDAREQLEAMSVTLQELALASLLSDHGQRVAAVERLRASAEQWMQRLPIHRPV